MNMIEMIKEALKDKPYFEYIKDFEELIEAVEYGDEVEVTDLEDMELMFEDLQTGYDELLSDLDEVDKPEMYLELIKEIGIFDYISLKVTNVNVPVLFKTMFSDKDELTESMIESFLLTGQLFGVMFA